MKSKTRIILVVVALIAAAVVIMKAFAENGNAVVSFSGTTINAGDNVSMTVSFPNDNAVAVDLYVSYDPQVFTYVSASDNNGNSYGNQSEDGSVAMLYMDQSEANNGISSVTFTFKAKNDITEDTSGNISITGASIDFKNNPIITEEHLNQTSANITVKANTPPPVVENLSVNPQSVVIKVGEESQLTSNIEGTTWSSSNEAVATVSGGLVKGVGEGTAEIVASANGNSVTIPVSVSAQEVPSGEEPTTPPSEEEPAAPRITPYGSTAIKINEEKQLTVDQDDVTWISSDDTIVTVSNGLIKGINSGIALITVKNSAGKTNTIQVAVYDENSFVVIPENDDQDGENRDNPNPNDGQQNNPNNGNSNTGNQDNQNGANQNSQNTQNSQNNASQMGTNQNQGNTNGQGQANSGNQGNAAQSGNNQNSNQNEIITAVANTVAKQGSANSTVEEDVPATGESTVETVVLIALITLVVASIFIRSRIKIK